MENGSFGIYYLRVISILNILKNKYGCAIITLGYGDTGGRKEKVEAVATQIRKEYHVNVEVILAELSEMGDIKKVIEFIKDKEIEILVNNAGFGADSLYQKSDLAVMEQLAKVNVLAPMELIHLLLVFYKSVCQLLLNLFCRSGIESDNFYCISTICPEIFQNYTLPPRPHQVQAASFLTVRSTLRQ